MLHRIAFPVVSEWYQDERQLRSDRRSGGMQPLLSPLPQERSCHPETPHRATVESYEYALLFRRNQDMKTGESGLLNDVQPRVAAEPVQL